MNVLVYNGSGVSQTSLSHTLTSLKALLLPHFAVQTITAAALASQPWPSSCALLVIPGGRDLPYVTSLAPATRTIKSYVENGGAFLGICAGAYYASKRVEWETGTKLEVSGDRPLGFFDGVCRGSVYPGFAYESESGARAVAVEDVEEDEIMHGMYYNGGGEFVGVEFSSATTILAKYVGDEGDGKIAAIHCHVGKGSAILWGTHPEYPLTNEPLLSALARRNPPFTSQELRTNEERRWKFMRKTLSSLGLHLPRHNDDFNKSVLSPLPQFLTSSVSSLPSHIYDLLAVHATSSDPKILQDSNDTFRLHPSSSAASILQEARTRTESEDNLSLPKDIVFYKNGEVPLVELTPKFSIQRYFSLLSDIRDSHTAKEVELSDSCGMGQLLLYGEAVTSTQTMLDRNPTLLRTLPAPLVSLATHQLSGRGRGSNAWVSPAGCLQFSILLRPGVAMLPASRLVFIQYLFALAVAEACSEHLGDIGKRVRIKWPNDIYAVVDVIGDDGRVKEERKKIGGILVSTNFNAGQVDIVVGCGLNVLNPLPTTSLSQLTNKELSMERTIATIMVIFEKMWDTFLGKRGSFEPFMDLYLERWLHSDQLVTLTTVSPPISVRIVGITTDYGLLRTMPERGQGRKEEFIDLQPDGNSFDLMAGLIKSKT
ncbi:class II aaRS and biotin synthetase [Ramaria rubella]|nr:class II aaRS and biotin synthetase [Ramaria rubella]